MTMMKYLKNTKAFFTLSAAFGLLFLIAACQTAQTMEPQPQGVAQTHHLADAASAPIMPDLGFGEPFNLINHKGLPFTNTDMDGVYSLVYFGFSHCPSACPMNLIAMADTYEALPDVLQEKVHMYFVTFDPQRDTPERLASYLADFHPQIIGITGGEEKLKQLRDSYYVIARTKEVSNPDVPYGFDHSTYTYFLSPQGEYITHYTWGHDPKEWTLKIAEDIEILEKRDGG